MILNFKAKEQRATSEKQSDFLYNVFYFLCIYNYNTIKYVNYVNKYKEIFLLHFFFSFHSYQFTLLLQHNNSKKYIKLLL